MVTVTIMIRVFIMENDLKFLSLNLALVNTYVYLAGHGLLLGRGCDGICTSSIMAMKAASVLS